MKHGVAFRKFSRTSSHRNLMLRNLVTSLLLHEQIKTTLPKARDASRLAEKMITLGKRRTHSAAVRARGFCLQDSVVTKLFGPLAERYKERPGGYTRIHKYGNRPGDNAPHAILELVDNPVDLRRAMTARAVGWELVEAQLKSGSGAELVDSPEGLIRSVLNHRDKRQPLRPLTQLNVHKVTKFGSVNEKIRQLANDSRDWMKRLMSDPEVHAEAFKSQTVYRPEAGRQTLNDSGVREGSGVRISEGALSRPYLPRGQYVRRRKLGVS